MDKDKSIMMQKQVRNNAQDLMGEFLDLKNWEQQMKKADAELRNSSDDQGQVLPPVRKKKSSSRTKLKPKENGSKAKKSKPYDYSEWDRFDADKACEELDKESDSDSGEELLTKEELEKKHEEATKHKVMGNKLVQQQKWHQAMACYNEAIKIFPYDAVFYANRALCHLKMENLYSAEADCTAAIQRDEHYVKAYHRRATARMALKQYKEAIYDLKQLLTLEPANQEAKRMLHDATKCVECSKSVIISSVEEEKKQIPIEAKTQVARSHEIASEKEAIKKVKRNNEKSVEIKEVAPLNSSKLPDWMPLIDDNVKIIKPITKLPHQRSKTPLKSIPVTITDFTTSTTRNSDTNQSESTTVQSSTTLKSQSRLKIEENNTKEDETVPEIPSVPKNAVQFLLTWRKYKSPLFRYEYLRQLAAEKIPKLFQDSMESGTFSEILSILKAQFIPKKEGVFQYLKYLSEVNRFRTLTMFLGKKEKEDLNELFEYCKNVEGHADDRIHEIRMKYEI